MQHVDPIFLNLSLILVVAGVTTLLFKYLKQPLVLGYVVAGFITGPHFEFFPTVMDQATITVWGEIGVVFLLFALGLDYNLKKIKKVASTGATTAIVEALIMMSVGVLVGRLMGWNSMNSLFLGGMLSISSTSIIIKAFDDLKLKNKRFSQVVMGVLVFEDLVAILLLVLLSTLALTKEFNGTDLLVEMSKLLLFLVLWFTGGVFLIPTMLRKLKRFINDETLIIVTVGMCMAMVVIASKAGFSPALGAFVMGVIFAETDESERIRRLISPLRNLFAAVFFISVGMLVDPNILVEYIVPILIITLTVLLMKPLAATIGVVLSGHSVKQSMQSGFCLGQIGEFSFIIASLGLSLKVIDAYLYPVIVSVSIITIFVTPYLIRLSEPMYNWLYKIVPPGWRMVMDRYGTGNKTLNHDSDWRKLLKSYVVRILIMSGWLLAVISVSFKVMPYVRNLFNNQNWIDPLLCFMTLAAMSPFLYALMIKSINTDIFDSLWSDSKYARGPLITLRLSRFVIGAIFIGVVIGYFLSLQLTILIPAVIFIAVIIALSRRLKTHYSNIEQQFFSNIDKTKRRSGIAIPNQLTNEIHMEYVDIEVYSPVAGLSIRQIHRKFSTGAHVIRIQRGDQVISLPSNDEVLYAGDRALIVGDDQQIQTYVSLTESPESVVRPVANDLMDIYQATLSENSPLCGLSAHVSELRNKYDFMLVGISRDDGQFLRPSKNILLKANDTLWIACDKRKLLDVF